jgi:regulator of cell morphogenesis and NO signaling
MRKEEDVLFPAIISLENAAKRKKTDGNLLPFKISNRVRLLMLEDEGTAYLLTHLTRGILAYQPPPQSKALYQKVLAAIKSFEADLKRHIYLENSILFPKAINVEEELLGR